MPNIDEILEDISQINPDALYPTDLKEAIIGYVERYGMEAQILLDRNKCLKLLEKQGMTSEEALEWFDINVIGAWIGDGTPLFATLNKDI